MTTDAERWAYVRDCHKPNIKTAERRNNGEA